MRADHTYPALEELKREAEGIDVLIEAAPLPVARALSWVAEIEYLEEKERITNERDVHRQRFTEGRRRIEATYGTTVTRALRRRDDGEQPRFDLDHFADELARAKAAIDDLYEDLDTDFLKRSERRELSALASDVVDAREYVRTKRVFDERKPSIVAAIEDFDEQCAPYADQDRYMVTSDRDSLIDRSREIRDALADLDRELTLHVLPDEDVDWLIRRKARFETLPNVLSEYNEEFVEDERERYAELFRTEHGPLNAQQQKAIVRDDRRNLVDASAGTGKTLTLTYRFLYLLEKGVPVDDIAAITYTRDAADEMADRIAAAADVDRRHLHVSTIHSFARELCSEADVAPEVGNVEPGAPRSELVETFVEGALNGRSAADIDTETPAAYRAFRDAFDRFSATDEANGYVADATRDGESWSDFVTRKLDTFVEKARTFDRSPRQIRDDLNETDAVAYHFGDAGAALVDAYEQKVAAGDSLVDYDHMIDAATELVRSYPEEYASRFSHVLVDEFQDVSDRTFRLVESFVDRGEETHLFCVGDDWQSIYGFRGSNVRYFTEYPDRFEDVTYTELQKNYRCPPSIVQAGADLMAQSSAPQNEKAVEADSDRDVRPRLHTLSKRYERRVADYAADLVEDALANGHTPDEIMVLSRTDQNSEYLTDLREELAERGIPYESKKGDDYQPDDYPESLVDSGGYDGGDVLTDGERAGERPPMVRTQSIHSSKGTEAPVVILVHAVDDDPDGIPIEDRTDDLVAPAVDITADHVPEERRLFYVALTRTEEVFHAIAEAGERSRYIEDIEDYLEDGVELIGECTSFEVPDPAENRPVNGWLQCDHFGIRLIAWPEDDPSELVEGATYRITDPDIKRHEEYGLQLRFANSTVERIDSEATPD